MPLRPRVIRPESWTDVHFGRLPTSDHKLLFIACFSNADDEGRLVGEPAFLKSIAFLYTEKTIEEVKKIRDEIAEKMPNFLVYKVEETEYIQFLTWEKHQKQRKDRRQKSIYPAPTEELIKEKLTQKNRCQTNDSQMSVKCQANVRQMSGKRPQEKKEAENKAKKKDIKKETRKEKKEKEKLTEKKECQSDDSQMTVKCQSDDGQKLSKYNNNIYIYKYMSDKNVAQRKNKNFLTSKDPIQRILGYFGKKFKEFVGFKYPCSFAKDYTLIRGLWKEYEKEHNAENLILNLIDIYFENLE